MQHSQWRWTNSFIQPTSCRHTSSNSKSRMAWRRHRYGETGGKQWCLRLDPKLSCSHSSSLEKKDYFKKAHSGWGWALDPWIRTKGEAEESETLTNPCYQKPGILLSDPPLRLILACRGWWRSQESLPCLLRRIWWEQLSFPAHSTCNPT